MTSLYIFRYYDNNICQVYERTVELKQSVLGVRTNRHAGTGECAKFELGTVGPDPRQESLAQHFKDCHPNRKQRLVCFLNSFSYFFCFPISPFCHFWVFCSRLTDKRTLRLCCRNVWNRSAYGRS